MTRPPRLMICSTRVGFVVFLLVVSLWPAIARAQGPLTNGENHAGATSTPGEIDQWTFDAAIGDYIILAIGEVGIATPDYRPEIRLRNPNGVEIGASTGALAAQIALNAPLSGTYTVLVRDSTFNRPGTALGNYLLHFVKAPGTIVVPAGDQGGPMTNGGNHAGTIHRADLDAWTFDAAKDDAILLSVGEVLDSETDPDFRPWVRLFSPTGVLLGTSAGALAGTINVAAAPLTGNYIVVVGDSTFNREGSAVGDYILHLVKAPGTLIVPAGDEGGPMTNGANHAGRIGAQGGKPILHRADLDAWTFTAAQNDAIVLSVGEVLDTELDPDFRPWVRLFGPNGDLLGTSAGALAGTIAASAPLSGSYTVVVSDSNFNREGSAVGDYVLHLVKSPGTVTVPDDDEGGPLTNGGNHAGRIGAQGAKPTLHRGDLDAWTFTATLGDAIVLTVGEVQLSEIDPDFRPWIRLYGPTGVLLGTSAGALAASINAEAPLTGAYTVVVSDSNFNREGSAVGDYVLHFVKAPGTAVVPDGDEGGPLTNGGNHPGRIGAQGATPIAHRADLDVWTFSATQNDAILLSVGEVLDSEIDPDFRPWIRLFRPDGTLLGTTAGALAATINVTAPLTGNYTVVVSDSTFNREGSSVGDYILHFVRIPAPYTVPTGDQGGVMTNNTPYAGRIGAPGAKPILQRGDLDVWTFFATQNSALSVTITETNIPTPDPDFRPWIRLYGPTGTLVSTTATTLTATINVNAPATGIYTVVVADYNFNREGSQVGDYNLTVNGASTPPPTPTTVADSYNTLRNTALVVDAPGVLSNDNANGGGTMTAVLDTPVSSGTLSLKSTGAFVYTPVAGFVGTVSFAYHAQTSSGGAGNVATVTITVTLGTPPTTVADSYSTPLNRGLVVPFPGVLGNDNANGGGAMTAVLDTAVTSGTLSLSSDGPFVYTPVGDFVGTASFTYHAQTANGAGNVATVTITVTAVTPTSVDDAYTTSIGTPLSIAAPGVLANDGSGGASMTAVLVGSPAHGTLTLDPNGGFVFTPTAGFVGADTFTYRAQNSSGAGNLATVSITVNPVIPTSVNDSYTTGVGASLVIAAPGVLANDNNGGATITAVLVTPPANGTLTLEATGAFAYTPKAGFTGTETFTYRAQNSSGPGNVATVTITVAAGIPTTVADTYAVSVSGQLTVPAPGVLGNDSSNGGGALSAQLIATTVFGTLTLNGDGSFVYTPNAGFSGTDTFSYRATSSGGSGNAAIVTLNVQTLGIQPPINLRVDSVEGQLVTLRWNPPATGPEPTGYVVEGGLTAGAVLASLPTGSTAPVFTLSAPTGAFFVRVHALDGINRSAASNEVRLFVSVGVVPSPPANLTGLVRGGTVALAWRNTFEGGAPTSLILDVTGPVSTSLPLGLIESFRYVGVPPGTYTMSLRAVNAAGSSTSSNALTLTFPGQCSGAPNPPTNVIAFRLGNLVSVRWDPPATGPAPESYSVSVVSPISVSVPTTGRSVSGVVGRGNYNLRIFSVNECGVSVPTPVHTVVVP